MITIKVRYLQRLLTLPMNYRNSFYNSNPSPKKSFAQLSRSKLSFRSLSKNKIASIDKVTIKNSLYDDYNQDYYVPNPSMKQQNQKKRKHQNHQHKQKPVKKQGNIYTYRTNSDFPNHNQFATQLDKKSIFNKSPQRDSIIKGKGNSRQALIINNPQKNFEMNTQMNYFIARDTPKQKIQYKNKQNKGFVKLQNENNIEPKQYGIYSKLKKKSLNQKSNDSRNVTRRQLFVFQNYLDKQNQSDIVNCSIVNDSILDMQPFL